jgi:ATP-dependent Lhr-like helicase
MELSGELVSGRFFSGVNSLQFASPSIGAELERAESCDDLYWMNAADPASPAGFGSESGVQARNSTGMAYNEEGAAGQDPDAPDPRIPSRLPGSRLCFRGQTLLARSLKSGRVLDIYAGEDYPGLEAALGFLVIPRKRAVHPERKIVTETINGVQAAKSPYAAVLKGLGFESDRGKLVLW